MKITEIKSFFGSVMAILGLKDWHQELGRKVLTEAQEAKLKEYGFTGQFITDLKAALNDPEPDEDGESASTQVAVISSMLAKVTASLEDAKAELATLKAEKAGDLEKHQEEISAKTAEIKGLKEKVKILSSLPEQDPQPKGTGTSGAAWDIHHATQLGGCAGEYFSLDRPYNMRAKAALLAAQGESMIVKTASSTDFTTLKEDLGAFYRTPWKDRIQSYLVALPTITKIFTLEPGHQDLDTLTNIWLGEFSQADSTSKAKFDDVTKGSYDFGTETLRMYDVMFVHRFLSLKDLERLWIGYLNREGSSALKLSFIEFLLVETAKALHNERELRWVNGVRKNPDPTKAGRAMEAADGIYEYLRKRIEGYTDFTPDGGTTGKTVYQIKPFDLPEITPGNIGEVFYLGTEMVPSVFRDTNKLALYVPAYMMAWYNKYCEERYGRNTDYKGSEPYVHEYPNVRIIPIPNADGHRRIFWTIEGNVRTYEFISGEMLDFNMEQEDWTLKVWSQWKESIQAEAVGRKYTEKAKVTGKTQLIWTNNEDLPSSYFKETPAGENPDVSLHGSQIVSGTITDVTGAVPGQTVILKAGDDETKVINGGNFTLIADWTPALGDTLTLMAIAVTGEKVKFLEIGRTSGASESAVLLDESATPSVLGASEFIVPVADAPIEITDLKDAVPGRVYTLYGNGTAAACSLLKKGDKFAVSADVKLSVGTVTRVVLAADGKFHIVSKS